MENFLANRLVSARRMAGLSLQGLADKLENDVSKQALNKYEQGKMKPNSKGIMAISNALNVPVNYFYAIPAVKVALEEVEFRKNTTKLSKLDDLSIREKAKDSFERYFELEEILQLNEKNDYFVFDRIIKSPMDAEDAANQLRIVWNLGYDPIPDVVEMLEDRGIR